MPTLQEKVLQLKLEAAGAKRLADWYEKQIAEHGLQKVEAFYLKRLGLNHIEVKAEFEGLQLRRQPRDTEKIAVKGVAQAQDSGKTQLTNVLLALRQDLISDGLEGIATLSPAQYHTLVLKPSSVHRESLRDRLISVYRQGR